MERFYNVDLLENTFCLPPKNKDLVTFSKQTPHLRSDWINNAQRVSLIRQKSERCVGLANRVPARAGYISLHVNKGGHS